MAGNAYPVDLGAASLPALIGVAIRHLRLILLFLIVAVIVAGVYLLVVPPKFAATCTFISSAQIAGESGTSDLGALSSAASRLGVDLRGSPSDLSPLYPWMLESRAVGLRVLGTEYVDHAGRRVHLPGELVRSEEDSVRRIDMALTALSRNVMNYGFDRRSGVTRVTATVLDPAVAAQVANAYVQYLDEYNQSVMVERAASLAGFLAERMKEFDGTIANAEGALRDFRIANRNYSQSPALMLEESRLMRNLELAQQMYLNLRSQFEVMRIEEFRRLPRLTVIDPAHAPLRRTSPRPLPVLILAGAMGTLAGLVTAFARCQWQHWKLVGTGDSSTN